MNWLRRAPEELIGHECYRLIHSRNGPCPDCPCAVTFRTGEPATVTHTGVDGQGGTTHAEIISLPFRDSSGQVSMVLESIRDVTERERTGRGTRAPPGERTDLQAPSH